MGNKMVASKILIVCVIFSATNATMLFPTMTSGSNSGYSSYQFYNAVNGYMKLHPIATDWDSARAKCREEGAEILSPTTQAILDTMVFQLQMRDIKCPIFTGIHDSHTKGTFHSNDGTPLLDMHHIPWKEYEGNFCGKIQTRDVVIVLPNSSIDTANKRDQFPFFCYKTENNATECGGSNANYIYSAKTGSCYKFHTEGRTWHEASKICTKEEAYLTVINSPDEALVLKDLFMKYPEESLESQFKNSALIGFLDWGKNEGWQTIFGATLEDAGYSAWSSGQPDHSGHPNGHNIYGKPFCGAIFRSAQLDDIWCDVEFAFICEKKSKSSQLDVVSPNN